MPLISHTILSVLYILIKNISLKIRNTKTLYLLGFTGMLILIFVFSSTISILPLLLVLGFYGHLLNSIIE